MKRALSHYQKMGQRKKRNMQQMTKNQQKLQNQKSQREWGQGYLENLQKNKLKKL